MEIHLLSKDGLILYSSHPHQGILTEVMKLSVYQNFLQSTDQSTSFIALSDEGHDSLFVAVKQQGFSQYTGDGWILDADIPTSVLYAERDLATIVFMIFVGVVLSIAILASIIVAKYISTPIKRLEKEMQKVAKSDFDIILPKGGADEINSMSDSFQKMVKDIKNAQNRIENQFKDLKKVEKLKEEFTTMVSHELRTPLTPIKLLIQVLAEGSAYGKLNTKQLDAIKKIESNASMLEGLISDIMDAQKLDMKKLVFNLKKFNISKFMEKLEVDLSPLMKDKKIEFEIKKSDLIEIVSDENRLHQIIGNLVRNSVDFVPEKNGKIELGSQIFDGKVKFYVKDNGIGIPKNKISNLFQKFYQVDTTHSRSHGGCMAVVSSCREMLG